LTQLNQGLTLCQWIAHVEEQVNDVFSSPGDEKGFSSRRRDPVRVHLPHLFGRGGYVVIRHPAELPSRRPLLYARLTAGG